jgi:hypothetical protein
MTPDQIEKQFKYDCFKERELASLLPWNLITIPCDEFRPLVEHCKDWLKKMPDSSFRMKTRDEVLKMKMDMCKYESDTGCIYIIPGYITIHDIRNKSISESWNIWCNCFVEYMKRREKECNFVF